MQVGTTKDQGLYNKPSVAVHPGALANGTLLQYSTIQYNKIQYKTTPIPTGNVIVIKNSYFLPELRLYLLYGVVLS